MIGWVVALLLAAAYWELVIAEGVHLGQGVVTWLYDLVALRYDSIKGFDPAVEDDFLGGPLAEALVDVDAPRVLDVGTGTGRCPLTLLRQTAFDGRVIGLDPSRRMLVQARHNAAAFGPRAAWVQQVGGRLPFAAGAFEAVTCLEALEFTPDPRATLRECLRVLKPGGLLLITNRRGVESKLLLGKTFAAPEFRSLLESLPISRYRVDAWQVDYDLAWAWKERSVDSGPWTVTSHQ